MLGGSNYENNQYHRCKLFYFLSNIIYLDESYKFSAKSVFESNNFTFLKYTD